MSVVLPVRPARPRLERSVAPRRDLRPLAAKALPVVGALAFLLAWEVTGRRGTFGTTWIPLTDILDELTSPARRSLLERAVAATFERAATGFVVGSGLAIALASIAAMVPALRGAVGRLAVSMNSIPWIALGPLLMVVVSRDTAPAVIAGLAVFFQVFVATSAGYASVARESDDLLRAVGSGRLRRFGMLTLPSALPSLFLGLKLAAPAALIGAIFGEWFGAERGIGLLLLTSMQSFNVPLLWSVALIAAGASMLAYVLLGVLERAATRLFSPDATSPNLDAGRPVGGGLRSIAATGLVLAAVIAAWHLYVEASGVSPLLVPRPSRVAEHLLDTPGAYASSAWATTRVALMGLVIGTLVGATLAAVTWWSSLLRGLCTPVVLVARSVPTLALMPVIAGILGYNDRSVVALAVVISFFPSFVFTSAGLRSLPSGAGDLMAVLGAPRRRVFRLVALPASLRQLAVAVRLSAGLSVVAAVVAEFMIGRRGLGRMFSDAYAFQDMARAWGVGILIIALAMTTFAVATGAERRVADRLG